MINKTLITASLPHNFLAEKMILSCVIFNSDLIDTIQQTITIETFYFKNHQMIYKNMLRMKCHKLPIDIVTLTVFLQDNGLILKIGGIRVLLDLGNQIPTLSYLNEYIRIVKEKFLRRCLIKFGYKVINSGYITNQSLEYNLISIEQDLVNLINQTQTEKIISTAQVLNNLFFELKNKFLNPYLPGVPSGFIKLDSITQGFQKSDLIIIAGRPSMGKTALSLNIALNCIKISKLPILFCSLEMSKEQILYRLLSTETGINLMKLRNGKLTQNDWIKLTKIMRILARLPFFIDDNPNLSIEEIHSKLKIMILDQTQIGLVIIDYLQLIQILKFKQGTRAQELSQITRHLKNLAKEFNIPIIALSQLNRNVENRIDQRPSLSDLRESGSIEQDADLVLLLSRLSSIVSSVNNDQKTESLLTELIIAKQRNGPLGTIKMTFNKSLLQFSDLL